MDQLDIAKELETTYRQKALEKALANNPEPEQWIENGQVLCIDCEAVIPPKRLAAKPNAARCITCQHKQEVKNGNRR